MNIDDGSALPLGRALETLESLIPAIAAACPDLDQLTIAGGIRRFEPLIEVATLVARGSKRAAALDAIAAIRGMELLERRVRGALLRFHRVPIELHIAAPDKFGAVLVEATGSAAHVSALRARTGPVKQAPREEDVYAAAGLPFVPPELRHETGEIEAAANGTLPSLVSRGHIRGDLHMHSTYSDGADTVGVMASRAASLGYEYIAITDHSERANAGRTLSVEDILRQRDEIARVRERFPGMAILHGVEVDIMPDGHLDFPDPILETFDIVLASLHDAARHDGKTLTRRAIQAMGHPLVTILTHPANQIVGRRAGYPLNFEALYSAATETGTALEVDGAPSHLDLDGEHARAALAAGCTLTIDSDCHRAGALELQMRLGVGTARRGWVEPRHVLNTRSLADVRAFIAAKRSRR